MEEWKSYLLSDLADIVTGKTPSTKIESYFGGGIHFITPGDINKGQKHVISTDRTLTNAGLNAIKGSIIEPKSICVSCIGNIGYVGMATMQCATNQQINSLVVKSGFDADFVYYLMRYLWPAFKNFEGQSTTLSILNKGLFSKIEVKVPSLKTQECIAKLLSSFDDKIELNNRINHNLEEQAILLVDRFLSSQVALSSPHRTLGDVCLKITDGSHFSPKDDVSSSIPMLSVKDMGPYGFNYKACKHISTEDYENMVNNDCVPKIGDVLVAKDGSYLKELFVNLEQTKQAILSSIAIFRPNLDLISPELLLYLLKQPRILQEVKDNYVSGSALPRIVLKDFKKLSFCLPSAEEQCEIRAFLSSVYKTIQKNQTESKVLASCRNRLLAQLLKEKTS